MKINRLLNLNHIGICLCSFCDKHLIEQIYPLHLNSEMEIYFHLNQASNDSCDYRFKTVQSNGELRTNPFLPMIYFI